MKPIEFTAVVRLEPRCISEDGTEALQYGMVVRPAGRDPATVEAERIIRKGIVSIVDWGRGKGAQQPKPDPDADNALMIAGRILELIEGLPDVAEDFADSVEGRTIGIKEWIEKSGKCTEAQEKALENMLGGVERWLERQH